MNKLCVLKIYTNRKLYEIYPDNYDKTRFVMAANIDSDIWIPELGEDRYILSKHNSGFMLEKVDIDENVIGEPMAINPKNPFASLVDKQIRLLAIFDTSVETNYYSLAVNSPEEKEVKRIGIITIGKEGELNQYPEKFQRMATRINAAKVKITSKNYPLVSANHAIIYYDDFGEFWIEDNNSTNGIYVNSFFIKSDDESRPRVKLSYGDVIDLYTVKVIFRDNCLQIDKITGNLRVSSMREFNPIHLSKEDNMPVLKRPPRQIVPLPDEPIKLPTPPSEQKNSRDFTRILTYMFRPLMWLGIPLVAGLISGTTGNVNWMTSSMYVIGPVMMVIQFIIQGNKTKKENAKKFAKYREKLTNKSTEIDKNKKTQNILYSKIHTNPEENLRRVLSFDWRIWERNADNDDYLAVRLGEGNDKTSFEIQLPEKDSLDEKPVELVEELEEVQELHSMIRNYPININLNEMPIVGVIGLYSSRMKSLLSIITQLSIHHSPDDLRIGIICDEEDVEYFDSIRFLPHLWVEGSSNKLIFASDNKNKDCDGKCYEKDKNNTSFCKYCYKKTAFDRLFEIFDDRDKKFKDKDSPIKTFYPNYLFIITDIKLIKDANAHEFCNFLLDDHSNLGIYSICAGEQKNDLPQSFKNIVTAGFEKGNLSMNDGETKLFHMDLYDASTTDQISRSLAPVQIENMMVGTSIPNYVSLLELHNAKTLNDLNLLETWNKQYINPIPIAPIGKIDNTKNLELDIRAKGIGPHGIVGGTTGSGKSEFLLAVILGMAIKCHPNRMSMVILDYKGGSTAESCQKLPHVRGTVTDLDKGPLTRRALAAIKYEIEYRESVFQDFSQKMGTRIEDLKTYISEVNDGPIITYLLVIVDELAELKIREPHAMEILEDIARRGRSVGIYLLLTTQNPQGVINQQIQANVNYKICFRISKDNSRGIIDSPEAAYISDRTPGRALMRVGNDELVAFQSAYTGAEYIGEQHNLHERIIPNVYEINKEGIRTPIYYTAKEKLNGTDSSQLNMVVKHVISTAYHNDINSLNDLWLPVLPDSLSLEYLLEDIIFTNQGWPEEHKSNLKVCIGLSDDLVNRQYIPTIFDFDKHKNHLAIYGASYSGKSTFLYAFMTSLALTNSPETVNIYMFDLSVTPNVMFEKLPHIGNIFTGGEDGNVQEGLNLLLNEIKRRSALFTKTSVNNISEYNIVNEEEKLPSIFIIVDNIEIFSEYKGGVIAQLEEILRTGIAYGIYTIATTKDKRTMPYEFRKHFESNHCCLRPDATNYETPRGFEITSLSKGRGIYKGLEFQVALMDGAEKFKSINEMFNTLIKNMAQYTDKYNVLKSSLASNTFTVLDLMKISDERSSTNIPVGLNKNTGQAKYINTNIDSQILLSYNDIKMAQNRLVYIYNMMANTSNEYKDKKIVLFTKDAGWEKSIINKNIDIKILDDNAEKVIDKYVLSIISRLQDKQTIDEVFISDCFGELLIKSSMNSYEILNKLFNDENIISKITLLCASTANNISAWSRKGAAPITRAINNQNTILIDGLMSSHKWCTKTLNKNISILEDEIVWINSDGVNNIRLAAE